VDRAGTGRGLGRGGGWTCARACPPAGRRLGRGSGLPGDALAGQAPGALPAPDPLKLKARHRRLKIQPERPGDPWNDDRPLGPRVYQQCGGDAASKWTSITAMR